jgi:hypothetical protein
LALEASVKPSKNRHKIRIIPHTYRKSGVFTNSENSSIFTGKKKI